MMALETQHKALARASATRTPFTFQALHRSTRGLSGSARAELFYSLPAHRQAEAWGNLRERVERERGADG